MTVRFASAAMLSALALLGCGDDDDVPMDAGPRDAALGFDGDVFPDAAVESRYAGDGLPRAGFCDGDDARELTALPQVVELELRANPVDHARPSEACSVAYTSLAADAVFRFTPPEPGIFTIQTSSPIDSPFIDPILYVRDTCDGTEPPDAELACNDDATVLTAQSRLSLAVDAGAPLFAIVDGFADDDAGPLEVAFDFVPMPPPSGAGSDTCADATEMTFAGTGDTLIARAMGDTTDASNESGCAGVPSTFDLPDHFHAFTLTETRDVTIRIAPDADYDPALYVLEGCDSTPALACHDTRPPGEEELVELPGLAAGRYVIGVDAFFHAIAPSRHYGPYLLEVVATRP